MTEREKSTLSLMPKETRWPKKGDRVFRGGGNWYTAADFPQDEDSRHAHIWNGYMQAGALLLRECLTDSVQRNWLVYPALFTYRHALEVAMKWIIYKYSGYSDVEIGDTSNHNLWELWKLAKAIMVELGGEDSGLPVVEQVIMDFHDLDRRSTAFRYAHEKDGQLIDLPEGGLNLVNLLDVMEGVSNFFDGADSQLSAIADAISDSWSEVYNY